jgi:4-hydroxy-3-polyprenylbenzoate decarboxylase
VPASRAGGRAVEVPAGEDIEKSIKNTSRLLSAFHYPSIDVRNRPLLINFAKDGTTSGRSLSGKLLRKRALKDFSILVLLDSEIDLRDYSLVLWKVFNNVDPKRDILRQGGRIVIDATRKGAEDGHTRPWPEDIEMTPEVAARVRERAKELAIEEFLART